MRRGGLFHGSSGRTTNSLLRRRRQLVLSSAGGRLRRLLLRPGWLLTLVGVAFGFSLAMCIQSLACLPPVDSFHQRLPLRNPLPCRTAALADVAIPPNVDPIRANGGGRQLMLIGVMTAQKLHSRAVAIWDTWARSVPGQVLFFVAENTVLADSRLESRVVRLAGADDAYPPQKKSFLMLKWMADHGLAKQPEAGADDNGGFDWFVRADDDVYLRLDRLEALLRSVDPSKAWFIGQAGQGTLDEYGTLSLADDDNFCMGGTGVIFSREALRRLRPHLADCLANMYTTHEDVEVGRCVKRHVRVSCSWNYEMRTVFYNNQSGAAAYSGELNVADVHQAITLHPLKRPAIMRRMHRFLRRVKCADLRYRQLQLSRDMAASRAAVAATSDSDNNVFNRERQPVLLNHVPKSRDEILNWDFFSSKLIHYCSQHPNCPRHNLAASYRYAISDGIRQIFEYFNRNARQRGRTLRYQSLQYGYTRLNPRRSVDYVLDMVLLYQKFRGRKASVSVRRHAYVRQEFAPLLVVGQQQLRPRPRRVSSRSRSRDEEMQRRAFEYDGIFPLAAEPPSPAVSPPTKVHMVLPLSGRLEAFSRFADNFHDVCLSRQPAPCSLMVVLFESAEMGRIKEILAKLREKFGAENVGWLEMSADEPFSRGLAVDRGVAALMRGGEGVDRLLFFVDVDVAFKPISIYRIQRNTLRGEQVYFPIVFSEYAPPTWADDGATNRSLRSVLDLEQTNGRGYFRQFGFGLASLYASDYEAVGGMNTAIKGWGKEDVDFFERCLKHDDLRLFRAVEPALVHVYHKVVCDRQSMPANQYKMCVDSRDVSYASLDWLARKYYLLKGPNSMRSKRRRRSVVFDTHPLV